MRAWQQREAVAKGLAEWQANPYYVAGRVTVPALHDTFACSCFFNSTLVDLLAELSGDALEEEEEEEEEEEGSALWEGGCPSGSSGGGGRGPGGMAAAATKCSPLPPRTGTGAALQQVPLPLGMAGRMYGELFMALAAEQGLVSLGLYRRKSENPGTRLSYVVSNPPFTELLEHTDRVFVVRPR